MKGESLVNNGQNVSISNEYDQEKCTEEEVNATDVPAKSIKAIDKTTVHRICSGQVVLTLATAVKELVENSIDAGATSVEIRLKDYGSCSIEVSDNGKGVEPRDFEGLALKHHTSKLNDFGDLVGVKTFGFRGEALSSLCALSDLIVVTRHSSQTIGTKLAFNSNGKLVEETPVSRQVGTTVTLQNLFHTLPVRHKEFLRNLKKEFGKMVQVLYSYCLISTNVRILCTNQCGKNGKTIVVSTESQSSLKENISSIFGPKQVASLLEIKQKPPDDKILSEYGISGCGPNGSSAHFQLEGFVSSCVHGKGRSAADRQFYFINNRPCDPAKVVRIVNEVYHHYNRHQFPAVVLNIGMKVEDVDVNVTPDKRQIMVNRERLLLATVKTTLICLYEDLPSVLELQNTPVRRALEARGTSSLFQSPPSTTTPTSRLLAASSLSQRFSHSAAPSASPTSGGFDNKAKKSTVFAAATFGGIKRAFAAHSDFQSAAKQPRLHDFCFKINGGSSSPVVRSGTGDVEAEILDDLRPTLVGEEPSEALSEVTKDDLSLSPRSVTSGVECSLPSEPITPNKFPPQVLEQELQSRNRSPPTPDDEEPRTQNGVVATVPSSEDLLPRSPPLTKTPTSRAIHSKTDAFLNSLKSAKKRNTTMALYPSENSATNEESTLSPADDDDVVIIDDTPGGDSPTIGARKTSSPSPPDVIIYDDVVETTSATSSVRGKYVVVPLSLDCLRHKLASSRVSSRRRKAEEDGDLCRKFRAKIAPSENASAEDELKKQLTKEEFRQMTVIGQFNLGFIVTRLEEDLFVVDQHATDEKYHFESLQKTCVLQSQKLIVPHTLELTAANEGVLLDNLHVFSRNGFEFEVDPQREAGRRVALTKMPHSRGWEFSRQDVEEMIFMLSDAPGVMCRPSRVNAMFASRACRKAVMIGTFLSRSHMRSLIDHMADMEQPWNCPHGRPTLRHLINLDMLAKLEQGE